jgi:hypothetical protein
MSAKSVNRRTSERPRDPDFISAEIALNRAAVKARRRAKQAGLGVVIVKEGRIVEEQSDNSD